jgi:acetate---CoA ligase (ADP-forming) subunit beta
MLNETAAAILEESKKYGWVLEPDAKRLFAAAGFDVPRFEWARTEEEAAAAGDRIGWPVVAKVVSPDVIHKSDTGGVVVGIASPEAMREIAGKFSGIAGFAGILVEEMIPGMELIVGAKIDIQFGPVVLVGMGGVSVEIYKDTAIRMAPVAEEDVEAMINDIVAGQILRGYRGAAGVNIAELKRLVAGFSTLIMEMADKIESVDLNPVLCTEERCVIADARIILKKSDN